MTGDPLPLLRADEAFEQEYPGAQRSAAECYVNLCRTGDLLTTELTRRLRADAGLSLTAFMTLATLDGLGGAATPGAIAEHVVITSASVTSLLDTLERRGLVVRASHPDDRRKVAVRMTEPARALVDRLLPGAHLVEVRVLAGLDEAERAELLRLLAKVQAGVARVAGEPAARLDGVRRRPARSGSADPG